MNEAQLKNKLIEATNIGIENGSYVNKTIIINMLHIVYGGDDFYDKNKYPNLKDYQRIFLAKYVTFRHLLNTIFHEVRHFYIDTYYNPNKVVNLSLLKQYIHWSIHLSIL